MAGWVAIVLLILAGLAIVLRSDAGLIFGLTPPQIAAGAFLLAMLIVVAMPMLRRYRDHAGLAVRDILLWAGIFLGAFLLYAYRAELPAITGKLAGMVSPEQTRQASSIPPTPAGERLVRLRRQPGGHFLTEASINGELITVIIDTGATTVVLRALDAQLIGFDPARLDYSVPIDTANGQAFAAAVRLPSLQIGPLRVANVDALVAKPGTMERSLLGMSFLSRVKYEFSGDFLSLRG